MYDASRGCYVRVRGERKREKGKKKGESRQRRRVEVVRDQDRKNYSD